MKESMAHKRLTPEEFGKVIEKGKAEGKSWEELFEAELNIGRGIPFDTIEQARLHEAYAKEVFTRTLKGNGVETHAYLRDKAPEWVERVGHQGVLDGAAHDAKLMEALTVRNLAYRMDSKSLGGRLQQLWDGMTLRGENPLDSEEFVRLSREFQDLDLAAKDIATTAGRVLSSMRIKPDYIPPDLMVGVLKATGGNPEEVLRVLNHVQGSKIARAGRGFQEMVINGLLSGPKTHLVNISGNIMKTFLMPTDKILGGAMTMDGQMVREGAATLFSLHKFLGDSWTAARKAYLAGDNILDAGNKIMDASSKQPIMTTYSRIEKDMLTRLRVEGKDVTNGLPPWMEIQARFRSFIGLPSRALLSMDEFFKQINYRANIAGRLTAEGMAKKMNPDALKEFVENGVRDAFDAAGRGTDAAALRIGQEATWTQPLKDGAYLGSIPRTCPRRSALCRPQWRQIPQAAGNFRHMAPLHRLGHGH